MEKDLFEKRLKELNLFIKCNGRLPFAIENKVLHNWMNTIRSYRLLSKLSQFEIDQLDEIGFIWDRRIALKEELKKIKFATQYSKLVDFIKVEKRFPNNKEDSSLNIWMSQIRNLHKEEKLGQWEKEKLDRINFSWNKNEDNWINKYEEIQTILATNDIKSLKKQNKLTAWFKKQSDLFYDKKLSTQRQEKLKHLFEQIDSLSTTKAVFTNDKKQSKNNLDAFLTSKSIERPSLGKIRFEHKFADLLKFKEEYHRLPSPDAKNEDEKRLGIWCQSLRQSFRNGTLSNHSVDRLKAIDFSFDVKSQKWNVNFKSISEYLEKNNGKFPHSRSSLFIWASRQFEQFEQLSTEKQLQLKSIDFINRYEVHVNKWAQKYNAVKNFIETNGYKPSKSTDPQLTWWLRIQLKLFRENKLPKDKIEKLLAIGVHLKPKVNFDLIWQERYKELLAFRKGNSNRWPSYHSSKDHERKLYNWCQTQRQIVAGTISNRKNSLSDDKIAQLNKIGFYWSLTELKDIVWEDHFLKIADFVRINKSSIIPSKINNRSNALYAWLRRQKELIKRGKLKDEYVKRLQDLGVI